jgi:heterodisulfide reductase subunit C
MNKWPLLGRARLGTFLKRMPVVGPLKMGLMMIFKPRTRSWSRTGEVLRQYVEEQKRLLKAKA